MTLRERLRALAESLPPGGLVTLPRAALEQLLEAEPESPSEAALAPADLTVAQVAERFGRSPQTVRDWIKAGKLRAYLFNRREYRVTAAALAEFEEGQRRCNSQRRASPTTARLRAWRATPVVT